MRRVRGGWASRRRKRRARGSADALNAYICGMYEYEYPRPSLTADAVVVSVEREARYVLLIERGHAPYAGRWALPGGFVNEGECAVDASRRELCEETGLELPGVTPRLSGLYDRAGRDPRGWTATGAYLYVVSGRPPVRGGDDAAVAKWHEVRALPPLAFDHAEIIADALCLVP